MAKLLFTKEALARSFMTRWWRLKVDYQHALVGGQVGKPGIKPNIVNDFAPDERGIPKIADVGNAVFDYQVNAAIGITNDRGLAAGIHANDPDGDL